MAAAKRTTSKGCSIRTQSSAVLVSGLDALLRAFQITVSFGVRFINLVRAGLRVGWGLGRSFACPRVFVNLCGNLEKFSLLIFWKQMNCAVNCLAT